MTTTKQPRRGAEARRHGACEDLDTEQLLVLRTPRKQKPVDEIPGGYPATPPKQRKPSGGENASPKTLMENLTLSSCDSPYKSARRVLHSTFRAGMPGREEELEALRDFVAGHVDGGTSGSMYISGPPGTGKTASLDLVLEECDMSSRLKKVYINCTSIKSSGAVYAKVAKELGLKPAGKTEKGCLAALEKYLGRPHRTILLVLDEIDQLESKNQSVLYTIFEWPAKPASRLILIGVANALDLTDRILPRLQSSCTLQPKLMHFAPYTKQQLVEIFAARLKAAGVADVFTPAALQLLAGKVAAISGDARRALDIGRRVVETVQADETLAPLENVAGRSRQVGLGEVAAVLGAVYGTAQRLESENADGGGAEDALPLQQKIVLCSLLLLLKGARQKNVTVGRLHEVYRRVCNKRNITSVDQAEFAGLCSLVETRGVVRIVGKKEPRLAKVTLEWDEAEVVGALRDKQLLSAILREDGCLLARG